jgi:dethiobiotin synthetase
LTGKNNKLIVIGTDTGVGKTVLSLLLMRLLYAKGENPFYLKLIQTGCANAYDTDSDARFIYQHTEELKKKDPSASIVYCYKNPKAPYCAARDEGQVIDVELIRDVVNKKSPLYSVVIMEAAGGLLVPVTKRLLNIDLIELTGATPIVAARAGLGTINHTLLTLEILKNREIDPLGVVFIDAGEEDTDKHMLLENMECIEKFSGIQVSGVIGKIQDFSNPEEIYYLPLEKMMHRHMCNNWNQTR